MTTVLAACVIAISILTMKFLTAIASRPRVLLFAAFVLLGTFASMLQNLPVLTTLILGLNRGSYWFLMIAVMSLNLDCDKGQKLIRIFAISTALMSLASLIDYFHIIDIPVFNEKYSSFQLEQGKFNSMVGRALTGPFTTRAVLGPYLALAWAVPLMELIHGKSKNAFRIAFWGTILLLLTLAILVCYSRALYLTIAICGFYAMYTSGHRNILRIMLLVVPLMLVFFFIAQRFLPHEMEVLTHRLYSLSPDKLLASGGHFRTGTFWATIDDLMRNPQGMGYGLIEYGQYHLVAHSIYTEHLRPAGVLGFILVCLFIWPVIKLMFNRRVLPGVMVLSSALLGVLANGAAHSSHNMLGAWIVIGLLYGFSGKLNENSIKPLREPVRGYRGGNDKLLPTRRR